MRRSGVALLDVLMAVGLVGVLAVPILTSLGSTVQETAVSEDYMLAEAVAEGALAEALAVPVAEVTRDLPYWRPVGDPSPRDAKRLEKLPIFRARAASARGIHGELVVDELAKGLLRYTVTLEWPAAPGSSENRTYALVRVRCPSDLSCHVRFDDAADSHRQALDGDDTAP